MKEIVSWDTELLSQAAEQLAMIFIKFGEWIK